MTRKREGGRDRTSHAWERKKRKEKGGLGERATWKKVYGKKDICQETKKLRKEGGAWGDGRGRTVGEGWSGPTGGLIGKLRTTLGG